MSPFHEGSKARRPVDIQPREECGTIQYECDQFIVHTLENPALLRLPLGRRVGMLPSVLKGDDKESKIGVLRQLG